MPRHHEGNPPDDNPPDDNVLAGLRFTAAPWSAELVEAMAVLETVVTMDAASDPELLALAVREALAHTLAVARRDGVVTRDAERRWRRGFRRVQR